MSLIHRWPLITDTKDQGTHNIPLINSAATTSTAGKIGQCYVLGNAKYCYADGADFAAVFNTNNFSISFWGYVTTTAAQYFLSCGVSGTGTHLHLGLRADAHPFIGFYSDDYNSSYTCTPNTWYHYTYVVGNGKQYIYINGALIGSRTYTTGLHIAANSRLNIGMYAGNYMADARINDLRIYDHALSAAEVHEVSKGLVLHYAFDDPYVEGTTNTCDPNNPATSFYNGATGAAGWSESSNGKKEMGVFQGKYCMKVTPITSGIAFYPYPYFSPVNPYSTTTKPYVTLSFDYYPTSQTTLIAYSYRSGIEIMSKFNGKTISGGIINNIPLNKWSHIEFTYHRTNDDYPGDGCGYIRIGTATFTPTASDYWLFANVQTENKDHSTPYVIGSRSASGYLSDSSGYGYNGTIVGSDFHFTTDSACGKYAMYVNNTTITHRRPLGYTGRNTANGVQEWTVSAWVYPTTSGTAVGLNTFNHSNYLYSGNSNALLYVNSGDNDYYNYSSEAIPVNKWTLVTFVFRNSDVTKLIYYNGVNKTNPNGPNKTSTPYGIDDTITMLQNFTGYIADYKVYTTALSAADVLTEYQRKAAITENHHFITGALVENGNSSELLWTYVSPNGISYRQSGAADRISTDTDGSVVFTKQTWCKSPMISVTPGEVLYYDLTYSNTANNLFYVGFEYYNAAGGSGSNEGCYYIIEGDISARNYRRLTGTITVPAQAGGAATSQLRLRVLNDWNNTGAATAVAKIHMISLRRINELKSPQITDTSSLVANDLREFNFTHNTSLFQDGFVGTQEFEER